jgi:hypothetical protein
MIAFFLVRPWIESGSCELDRSAFDSDFSRVSPVKDNQMKTSITAYPGWWRASLLVGCVLGIWLFAAMRPQPLFAADDPLPSQITSPSGKRLFLPLVSSSPTAPAQSPVVDCPATSTRSYDLIPIEPPSTDRSAEIHGDLNLALRGYVATNALLKIIDVDGPADDNAPQFSSIFGDARTPQFTSAYRVYDWDWGCGGDGCRSAQLTPREVSLLGLGISPGEAVSIPSRGPRIYAGEYKVLVLYATEDRVTLGYTRRDSVAPGYTVHMEKLCTDPNLVALYRQANANGRVSLPALRNGEVLGTARAGEILVSIRDKGTFMEPRSRKDWWKGR